MSQEVVRRVIVPLCLDLGARYIVKPYLGRYDDEDKTIGWGLGHKKHGDKRHRTSVTFTGIVYRDGDRTEGETRIHRGGPAHRVVEETRQPAGSERKRRSTSSWRATTRRTTSCGRSAALT